MRTLTRVLPVMILMAATLLWGGNPALAYPPTPPGVTTTRAHLAELTVAPARPMTGYSRSKFPHWSAVSGSCNTRETVLKRDGNNVVTNTSCYPTSGSWYSVYDRKRIYDPADVSIDHVVALANAWRSGADSWTTTKREAFANDRSTQQLIAVSITVNSAKGDQSPDQWKPPNTANWCIYARSWINVKYVWDLDVTSPERAALTGMLANC